MATAAAPNALVVIEPPALAALGHTRLALFVPDAKPPALNVLYNPNSLVTPASS
jgi:hypothetical protein